MVEEGTCGRAMVEGAGGGGHVAETASSTAPAQEQLCRPEPMRAALLVVLVIKGHSLRKATASNQLPAIAALLVPTASRVVLTFPCLAQPPP